MASIAFFTRFLPSDNPNGVSVQVHRYAQALTKRGHAVTCFSFSPKPEDALYQHVKLDWEHRSKLLRKLEPAIAFRKANVCQFDIIHYHGDDYLCKGSKKRVRTFYGSAIQEAIHAVKAGRFFYQLLFYLFELVSCLKKGTLSGISVATRKSLPMINNVIPCCIPLENYTVSSKKSDEPSILFLGDLDSRKRGRMVLEIFHNIVLPAVPDCTLTVVGPQACSGNRVHYLGNIGERELIREYQRSWIYCMASSYEGFGVPAIEASACGTPVVATVNSGIKEIISHNKNGLLCTAETLGETIISVLRDDNLRQNLAVNARLLSERYDSDIVVQHYERIYSKILGNI